MLLIIIVIMFISYITVQQQDEGCKKHQKYNHAVAGNSTTWLLNTLYWLLKLYFQTGYRGLFALSYRNPIS